MHVVFAASAKYPSVQVGHVDKAASAAVVPFGWQVAHPVGHASHVPKLLSIFAHLPVAQVSIHVVPSKNLFPDEAPAVAAQLRHVEAPSATVPAQVLQKAVEPVVHGTHYF